jgi:hypothetical protein
VLLLARFVDAPAQGCRRLQAMLADFQNIYPTGDLVERVSGEAGQRVMQGLGETGPGVHVAFLYSGDGPVTGARGRYLYLVLDEDDCILRHDWIDGEVYDRLLADQ